MKKCMICVIILCTFLPKNVFAMAQSASCACVMDAVTGEMIFEKNSNERRAMASTTKIMTAITALENSSPDDIVTVSKNAERQEGSSAYLRAGMSLSMREVLYGLMLNSGNDAAVAVAESVSGSVESFAGLMNEKAHEIGAYNTSFENPSGLDSPNHYTTARDLALITRYALKNPDFREIVSTRTASATPVENGSKLWFSNHNKLLARYEGCIGVKTGYTSSTGRCLVSAAQRNNMTFIAVTLNDGNDWNDHTEMLDYAFSHYKPTVIVSKGDRIKTVLSDGKDCYFIAKEDFVVPSQNNGKLNINIVTHIMNDVECPINAGEKVGYLDIMYNGNSIGSVDVISESDLNSDEKRRVKNSFYSEVIKTVKLLCI